MSATVLDNKISEEKINVRYSDIDFDKSLKMFSLLNFFQDIASDNAEMHNFGYSFIYPKNLMWVLLKYRIEFDEYPTDINNLTLKTEPRGCNRLFAYRNFELSNDKKILARASSMWTLLNIETKSMENVENVFAENSKMVKFVQGENDLKFDKIPTISRVDYEKKFEVRYNDIDVNMHANNANYIIWAMEPLNYEYKRDHSLKTVDMMYKKEIKFGEELISQVQINEDNTTIHTLKHACTGDELCVVKCLWK